jgi:hypothetical protein
MANWASAQQMNYDWLGRRKTGKRWLVALTVKLLNVSWDIYGTIAIKFSIQKCIPGRCKKLLI